jgi:chorismate-pyruvate lyase
LTGCRLSDEEIRKLDRDLRILLATNGTLTRILSVVANEEIVVHLVKQQIRQTSPEIPGSEQLATGGVLQRRILLKGRSSGHPLVAAESLIAIDQLPPAMMTSLTNTDRPIGEVMTASRLETFKEAAQVWLGELPDWLAPAGYSDSPPRVVARRYRIIAGGQPVLIITEYFLRNVSHNAPCEKSDCSRHSIDATNWYKAGGSPHAE